MSNRVRSMPWNVDEGEPSCSVCGDDACIGEGCPHATPNRVRPEEFTHSFALCRHTASMAMLHRGEMKCPDHKTRDCIEIYVPISEVGA